MPAPRDILRIFLLALSASVLVLATVLFFPPVRNWFFASNLWPLPIPGEVRTQDIESLRSHALPGDVVVESNLHFWQWVALCKVFTGSTWVHTSLVDADGQLLTVSGKVVELPMDIYLKWRSTRLALVRPPYASPEAKDKAIAYARSRLGTPYDPWFEDPAGSCTGLVAEALSRGGIKVPPTRILGHTLYAARSFFEIPGAKVLWRARNGAAPARVYGIHDGSLSSKQVKAADEFLARLESSAAIPR